MPAPPERSRPEPQRPRPESQRPRRDYAAEEEAGRQLTNAHIQFRRGLTADSEAAARSILAVRPGDAGAWELLGDIQAARSDFASACEAFQTALKFEPGRASAESKFGQATLRRAERQRKEKLGVAYAASATSLVRQAGGQEGRRNARWSVFGSVLCPGLGQIVSGQVKKGAVLIGIFLVGLGLLAILPHGIRRTDYSPGFWIVSALLTAEWVYAIADAALAAPPKTASPAEKDGWQV